MHKFLIPGILVGVGLGVALLSIIIGFVVFPIIIDSEIENTIQLRNETDAWDDWVLNPVPVYLKFYIWHVTNPKVIEERGKPELIEKGPYVFSQIRAKDVSSIDEDSDTLTYQQYITYFFEEALSVDRAGNQLRLDDRVNVVNLPFITFSTALYELNAAVFTKPLFELIRAAGETFVKENVTVGQVLFDGWEYPTNPYDILIALSGGDQPQFNDGKFGYYRGSNISTDGVYTIRTGLDDISRLGEIVTFNGSPVLDWWDNPDNQTNAADYGDKKYCNEINGTDGGIFQPFLTKETVVPIFSSDICRSVNLVYEAEGEHQGIKGYKYAFPPSFYEHPEDNHDNYCFCRTPGHPGLESRCAAGLIRLFGCQGGPLVTSSPHFYNGEKEFLDKIDGMDPKKDDHETYLLLQPDGGFPLKIRKRIQMSLEIQNFNNSFDEFFNGIEYTIFPALWASEETELNEELADRLKGDLLTPVRIVDIVKWVFMAVGLVIAIVGGFLFWRRRRSAQTV